MVKRITSNHVLYAIIFFTHYGLKVRATDALDCNFDKGLCNWTQPTGDDFDWKWTSRNTSTANTGPKADHTSGEGAYVYIDKTSIGKAWLKSPPKTPGTYCFSFWYYMYGQHVGTLRVFQTKTWIKLFEESGNKGKLWKLGQKELIADQNFRIRIHGIVNNSDIHDLGYIAIDDIVMLHGQCPDCETRNITNGQFTAELGTKFGQIARQSCNTGYILHGNETVICTKSGWNDTKAQCSIVDCSDPSPSSGKANSSNFQYGSVVEIKCVRGYKIRGNSSIACQADGSWSSKPVCEQIECSMPSITNGITSESVGNTTYNQTLRLECADGYTLIGNSIITCQADGYWTSLPVCDIQESENKALIAVYVSVPIVVVALVTGLIIIIKRRGLIKCMASQYSNKKNIKTSQTQAGSSFSNRAYIGHNIETQPDKENHLPEDTDYAVITEEQDRKRQSESNIYYNTVDVTITQRENDDHDYNHTDNVTAPFFDMSYSHVSKNNDENNVKSNYNTTILPCRTNEGFQSDVQDENNKYDILDSNVTVQRTGTQLEEDLDPEYDHAKAGGTDPEDLDDYSHLNGTAMKSIKNDAKEVSGTEYEYAKEISEAEPHGTYPAQVKQVRKCYYKPENFDFEVDNRDSVENDRHYFVLEKEDNDNAEKSGSFESNVHDYFVLEKMET